MIHLYPCRVELLCIQETSHTHARAGLTAYCRYPHIPMTKQRDQVTSKCIDNPFLTPMAKERGQVTSKYIRLPHDQGEMSDDIQMDRDPHIPYVQG